MRSWKTFNLFVGVVIQRKELKYKNMNYKQLLLSALVGAVSALLVFLVAGLFSSAGVGAIGIGPNHYQKENFLQGFSGGRTGQFDVSNAGAVITSSTLTVQGASDFRDEISLDASVCASAEWNPGAVVSSTVATTSLAMPSGYSAGDALFWGLSTSTAGVADAAGLSLDVTPTNVASGTEVLATLSALNGNVASRDIATATLSVCYADVP